MTKYDHKQVEEKWNKKWTEGDLYRTPVDPDSTKKKYILDMFPYPSGATMHVGHLEGYVGTDILARYLRMKGFSVLHPMGWDAFGLPAENYAIKTSIHPDKSTHENISTFKRQLLISGLSYDWDRELDTSSPAYYKWTQWLFIQLFKRGLAYKKKAAANWCPKDETVLANEQVVNGKCERCDTEVVQKELDQWFFKITEYADRLIEGLDKLDWLGEVKTQQINWIGRKTGMKIRFDDIEVFTTRPDTLAGATFVAVAAPSLGGQEDKTKVGEFTGKYVINPLTGKKIPVWKANYVSGEYGSGAIMGVPAHDERDREFATKYKIDIVDMKPDSTLGDRIIKEGWGEKAVTYHLRDWLVSRQRYWGDPIPMIWCEKCEWQPIPEKDLPLMLPTDVDFKPQGESPIARSKEFQKDVVCPKCGGPGRRETDTMDGFVDNSWYFIRFADPKNKDEFVSQAAAKTWLPVDTYVGGGHVVQHLLFARFFWKVLMDAGLLDKSLGEEPFLKLRAPGWILGPDSRKMSKRWGNVITPDDVIGKHGADTLRVYEMFMGPFEAMKPWSITGVEGTARFLDRIYRLFEDTHATSGANNEQVERIMNKLIKKVGEDIETMSFNTAVAAMMTAYNEIMGIERAKVDWKSVWERLLIVLAPFAPYLTEELWEKLGNKTSVHKEAWPTYDESKLIEDKVLMVVQVNGKVRERLEVEADKAIDQGYVSQLAKSSAKVKTYLSVPKYREIFVPSKLINFVV